MKLLYNRYVPQADGSFRKTKLPENNMDGTYRVPEGEIPAISIDSRESPQEFGRKLPEKPGDFFRNLLPGDFNTEDLIVILLLLLLSQEGQENRDRALLTLGAYLFL